VKCSADCFFESELFCEQLLSLLFDLRSLLFKLGVEFILLLLRNSMLFYHFLFYLLQGHCSLLLLFLRSMKVIFGCVNYSTELRRLISQLWFFGWQGRSGYCTAGLKRLLYSSKFCLNTIIQGCLLGFYVLHNIL
jgi:hypothetical protein